MPAHPQTHAPVAHIMQQHGERGERTSGRYATKEGFVPSLNRVQLGSPQNAGERLSFEWVPARGNAIANVPARVAERRIRNPSVANLRGLTAPFENAPPPLRRSSWPRHAHPASPSSRTVGYSLTRDTSASLSACVSVRSRRNRLRNDFASR